MDILYQCINWKGNIEWIPETNQLKLVPFVGIYFTDNTRSVVSNVEFRHDSHTATKHILLPAQSNLKNALYDFNSGEILHITYETKDGIRFVGSTDDNDVNMLPHGSGTWTFPDGSTFSGDSVAFEGVPHGIGTWNNNCKVEFIFGKRIKEGIEPKPRKIKWN